jgi:hypothetical protein
MKRVAAMTSALKSNAKTAASSTCPPTTSRTTDRRPYLATVPDCEPPFDDERSAASRIQHLRQAPRAKPRTVTQPDKIVDADVPGWSQDPDIGVRQTATAQLPDAQRSGQLLARALVEVLSGQRPLPQLRVHCSPEVFAGLQSRQLTTGALGHLLTVRVCEPADGAAEVAAVFRRGRRVRALAFRIQGVDGRWRVTALQTA